MERTSTENCGTKTGQLILSQTFKIGSLSLRYYGLIMVAAIVLGYFIGWLRAAKRGFSRTFYDDLCFWLVLCGFIGARIYYVLFYPQYYRGNFMEVFKVWHGGLAIYGAVLGGILALLWLSRRHKKDFFDLSDTVVFGLPLAQAFGRLGNFVNYEAFGIPTNLPWKMFVPPQFRPENYRNFSYFHPTFAYEAIWDILVFSALFWIDRKLPPNLNRKTGLLTGMYLILYSIGRFFIESIRLDSAFFGPFRGDQLSAILLAAAGLAIIYMRTTNVTPAQ